MISLARLLLASLLVSSLALVPPAARAQAGRAHSQQELDRMLAPIALYPDALLSQILLATTFPHEIDEAAAWSRAHPGLDGDAAVQAAADRDWDPSVRSMVAFPDLLARMDENSDWVISLGDAFLMQGAQVMDALQGLRRRAQAAGTLASDAHIQVTPSGPAILIAPAQPQIVYLPYYDPLIAFGPWWWPSHPPRRWAPWPGVRAVHSHHRPHATLWWGTGIGLSAGFFFGVADWHRRHVRVVHGHHYATTHRHPPAAAVHAIPAHRPAVVRAYEHPRHATGHRHAEVRSHFPHPAAPAAAGREERRAPEPRINQAAVAAPIQHVRPQASVVQAQALHTEAHGRRDAAHPPQSARRAAAPAAHEHRREARHERHREQR